MAEENISLLELRDKLRVFASERNWEQFHTPRNLLLALVGEVGELSEIFQWRGEVKDLSSFTEEEKKHVGEEISDVLLYLLRFADRCDINVANAVLSKIDKNASKYPKEKFNGVYKA